jgi:sec-independent protein translocase protein TatA
MMGLDNPIHIAFLLILVLLVFGAKRLPEMGRSLGSGMRGFKDALTGDSTQTTLTAQQAATTTPTAVMPVAGVSAVAADGNPPQPPPAD